LQRGEQFGASILVTFCPLIPNQAKLGMKNGSQAVTQCVEIDIRVEECSQHVDQRVDARSQSNLRFSLSVVGGDGSRWK
jgi:hypothetical protein